MKTGLLNIELKVYVSKYKRCMIGIYMRHGICMYSLRYILGGGENLDTKGTDHIPLKYICDNNDKKNVYN